MSDSMSILSAVDRTATAARATVRPFVVDDLEALMPLFERQHAASHWAGLIDFSEGDTATAILTLAMPQEVESGNAIESAVLVAEVDGELVGAIAVLNAPMYFNVIARTTQELFWVCEDAERAFPLLDAAEAWGRDHGAVAFLLGSQHGTDEHQIKVRRAYGRKGFHPFSHGFLKELRRGH